MKRPSNFSRFLPAIAILLIFGAGIFSARAQELDFELMATARVLPEVGTGLRALRRDSAGRFYALSVPGAAVMVYSPSGRFVGKIPQTPTKETAIAFGADLDVDARSERIYVADRDANLIRVYSSIETDGKEVAEIPVDSPISVAALPGDQVAVSTTHERRLVQIYDFHGKVVNEFGGLADLAFHRLLNRYLNGGRLVTDPQSRLYVAFLHYPEPTVRRYDLTGQATLEIELGTLEFAPIATAKRHVISDQDEKGKEVDLKPVVNAVGIDPASGDVWFAVGDELVHFDSAGVRKGTTYRTFAMDGQRVEPVSIIIEPTRMILAASTGVYTYTRPDLISPKDDEEGPIQKAGEKPGAKPDPPSQKP